MKKYVLLFSILLSLNAMAEIKVSEVSPEIANHPVIPEKLSKEFNENSISANKKYAGKSLVIVTSAISVDENSNGKPVVTVQGENPVEKVELIFKSVDDNIINIKKGSFIQALCESPKKSGGTLQLSNCEMIIPN